MEWNNYCVTNAGVEVLKKAIGGKKVTITAAKSGTDTVAESKLKEQSALSGTVRNVTIANATNQPEGYRVTLRVTNTGVKSSYIFKQLGLFATAEDESEVLFAILQSENGEIVPDESELYTYDVSLIIAISDTSNITVNVDKTSYVTEEELDGHKADKSNPHGVTKAQVGLGNVPNVSTNDQTPTYTVPASNAGLVSGEKIGTAFGKIARAVASLIAHIANKSNPHSVTKAQVGLGNADNTSDVNKPISSATQTALNGKSDKTHKHKIADISDMPTALPANGGNANTVDGKHASDFAVVDHTHSTATASASGFISNKDKAKLDALNKDDYYPAQKGFVFGGDYNSLMTNGIYELLGTSDQPTQNAPDGNNSNNDCYVQVFAHSANYVTQIATSGRRDKTQYIRSFSNGVWDTWVKLKAGEADKAKTLSDWAGSAVTSADNAPLGLSKINSDGTNNPFSFWSTLLTTGENENSEYKQQWAFPWGAGEVAQTPKYRVKDSGVWSPWSNMKDNGNASTIGGVSVAKLKGNDTKFVYTYKNGLGAQSINQFNEEGHYFVFNYTDSPTIYGFLDVSIFDGDGFSPMPNGLIRQLWSDYSDPSKNYIRLYKSVSATTGTWTEWTRISDGGNSDTVDGKHANEFYPAKTSCVLGGDYNDLKTNGIFEMQGDAANPTANTPNGNHVNNNFYVQVFVRNATYLTQIAIPVRADKTVYIRSMSNGVWNSWGKIKSSDADTVGGKHASDFAAVDHTHTKSQITDFPASLPANGGNSATVNGHTVESDVPANAKFTDTQYSPFIKSGTGAKAGLVPAPSTTAGTSKYLCENGTWAVPPDTINTIKIKQGSALGKEIDISLRKQAYIVFYKITTDGNGTLTSFIQPFAIEDTTPATAILHTTICSGSNLTVVYSLTTSGKITLEGSGGYSYKIFLFD